MEVNIRSEAIVQSGGGPSGLQGDEGATFCRSGEDYRLNFVYCPEARDENNAPIPGERDIDPALDAVPKSWHVRVIFDELLDPDVEDLRSDANGTRGHLDQTLPVALRCGGVELTYDGWYEPSGSHLTYPPGPALIIQPNDFVATGTTDCEVSVVDSVVDKDAESVPEDQRGPYTFGIALLAVYGASPGDGAEGVVLDAAIKVEFNAPINLATVGGQYTVTGPGGAAVAGEFSDDDGDQSVVVFTPADLLAPNTTYTVTVVGGQIADTAGGVLPEGDEPAVLTSTFTTGDAE